MADARRAAASVLVDVTSGGKYSNLALGDALNKFSLEGADRALTSFLVYGTLDRLYTIDAVIGLFAKKGIKSIPPYTAAVMRSAVFQILFAERIPESAAVNEAVKLIKKSKENRCSGFANAVLRSVVRESNRVNSFIENAAPNIKYSCHKSIYDSLCEDYGNEFAEQILESTLSVPKTYLRVNTLKISAKELISRLPSGAEIINRNCISIQSGFDFENHPTYKEGLYIAEGLSSQLAAESAAPKPNERMLDVCAAPGGKSFTAAFLMENKGEIVSCDIHPHRVKLIENGEKRLGLDIIKPIVNDASVFNEELGLFDSVLCDVPCSGFGVMIRKPDIKLREHKAGIEELQYQILCTSAKYVKSGGKLVYSTCTLRKAENENVTQKFLNEHSDFIPCNTSFCDKTFFPHIDNTDGFFISVFKKV